MSQKKITMFDRWVELPSDLLHKIVKHLHSPKDYVRFRAVCKSWNIDIPKTPNHIRGPWLVLPFNDETLDIEEKDFYLRLPEMQNIILRGSYFGWLISVGIDGVLRMLNPFTKAHFDLPPMQTIPDIVDYLPDVEGREYVITTFLNHAPRVGFRDKVDVQKGHLQKIIISSSPDNHKQDDFMAITIYGEYDRLAFCKFGDTKWTEFSTPEINSCLEDAIFFEGKIYAIDSDAMLFEFDVKTSTGAISEVPEPDGLELYFELNIKYLIRSVEGSLLLVIRHLKNVGVDTCYKTDTFDIFKLDQSAKQWTRMFSLGNYVLVVGFNSSVCVLPFSDGKGNWVRNCIYFSDNNVEGQYCQRIGGHDAGVFNLEDGRVKELFPNSELLYPPPIWLFSQNFIS